MARIVSVYSYRGGTGKTNCIANIAAIVARYGYRVCIVDANLQSPGIHILFGLQGCTPRPSLNHYLWAHCSIKDAVYDVTQILQKQGYDRSKLYLVPASSHLTDKVRILREGYDLTLLQQGLHQLIATLQLDYLFIDTHPGFSEETLLAVDQSDTALFVLSPDHQDFQGIGDAVTMARQFTVPQFLAVINKAPTGLDVKPLISHIETTYSVTIAEILPYSEELLCLASRGIFALNAPTHHFNQRIEAIVKQIMRTENQELRLISSKVKNP